MNVATKKPDPIIPRSLLWCALVCMVGIAVLVIVVALARWKP